MIHHVLLYVFVAEDDHGIQLSEFEPEFERPYGLAFSTCQKTPVENVESISLFGRPWIKTERSGA